MAAKGAREKIRLVSTAETGHFYTTTKNKRNMREKMEIKNLIRLCVSMLFTKKLKSNNLVFTIKKPDMFGFFIFSNFTFCHKIAERLTLGKKYA